MTQKAASIARQLRIVFAISILLLLISSLASFLSNWKLIQASRLVNRTNEIIIDAYELMSVVKDAETAQRGYIITQHADFLDTYNGGYQRAISIYNKLKQQTKDNPRQQSNLNDAKVLIDQRFERLRKTIEIINQEGKEDADRTYQNMIIGKKIMDDLRAVTERIKAEENRLLSERTSTQESYTAYTPVLVIIAGLLAILVSVSAYFRIKADLEERARRQAEDEQKYKETITRISAIENVTQKISEGQYDTRSSDHKDDELGRISSALNAMAEALERNFNELEQRTWLQAGSVAISNAIRGERIVKQVADRIIGTMATYVQASVGTLYLSDQFQNLKLQGSYAAINPPENLKLGEGLIGQALKLEDAFVTEQLPGNYLKVGSSIGFTTPAYAVILPLRYGAYAIGAIELGFLHRPTEQELLFLNSNAETISISLNAAVSYERMEELLEETQAQSEELQSQHEELENANAELELQTEKLQASEEELKVQQEELQQANAELEERSRLLEERNLEISERNAEIKQQAAELAQSAKYKSEFLANMSHELRTPLNSILLLSRLLSDNTNSALSDEQVEYAKVIQSSGNGLLTLIDEILDLSKIEAGKMQLEFEDTPLSEIAEDIRVLFEPVAKDKGIDFLISLNDDLVAIETDKQRLEQVLKNLISNAIKFTTEGSVSLAIDKDPDQEGFVQFAVTDTGIGIPTDKQALIFDAFRQADGSTRRKYGGTGLGLSISKELSRLLGGEITVRSTPGEGSTFSISIPIERSNATVQPLAAAQAFKTEELDAMNGVPTAAQSIQEQYISPTIPESIPDDRSIIQAGDRSILIVEDDVAFARSLLDFARKKGYKGIVSVRGDEAAPLALKYKPVGVLLDIQLPVKSGWQVMEELKKDTRTRAIPVHIMSSHSLKKESLLKGAVDFIDKPFAFEQMQEVFGKLEYVLNRTTKKVLIVEENPKHAKALAYFLETFNINADIKNSIPASVSALQNDTDCVILDMGVPDARAYQMLDEIKKQQGLEHLPIIVFTGKSLSLSEEQRIRQYADSIVVKTAHSYQRILDEVSLFLHLVEESKAAKPGKDSFKKLGALSDILRDRTVLVVDDDVRNIFSLTKALEGVNMNVITAVDGKEAIDRLNEYKNIDIVLLDMMMPQMDGYEAARRIRENPAWKKLPVIAVTAKAMTGDREKCIQAGASDYITKPIDIDQLLSLLRVWLYERS